MKFIWEKGGYTLCRIFWKNWVFIWKEDIMKKGILNEVNEIRRMMGLVSEQNYMDEFSKSDDNVRVGDFQPFIGKDLYGDVSSPKEGKRIIKKFGIEKGQRPGWDKLQIFTEKNETDSQHDADNQADRNQEFKQFRLTCQSGGLSYWDYGAVRSFPVGEVEPPLAKLIRKTFCLAPGENPYNP